MARLQRRQDKAARKAVVKQQRQHSMPDPVHQDSEIAGIRPGPQPVPAWVRTEPRKP